MNILTAVVIPLLIMIVLIIVTNRMSGRRKKTVETSASRLEGAIWGWATVLSSTSQPTDISDKIRVEMELEVHLPGNVPYQARTVWMINPEALAYVAVGKDISVKVNPNSPKYVYPHAPWATFVE